MCRAKIKTGMAIVQLKFKSVSCDAPPKSIAHVFESGNYYTGDLLLAYGFVHGFLIEGDFPLRELLHRGLWEVIHQTCLIICKRFLSLCRSQKKGKEIRMHRKRDSARNLINLFHSG